MSAAKPTPMLRRLFDLPLGARFRYQGHPRVHVLLSYANCGLVGVLPNNEGQRQSIVLCLAADSRAEFEALMVEFVPVVESAVRDELLEALRKCLAHVPPDTSEAKEAIAAIAKATGSAK